MRVRAALNFPKSKPEVVVCMRFILERMTGNPYFPRPRPPLARVAKLVDDLAREQAAMHMRTRGQRTLRDAKLRLALAAFHQLKAYVQEVADERPDEAEVIIASSGMDGLYPSIPTRPPIGVKSTGPGRVEVRMRREDGEGLYECRFSIDGVTWKLGWKGLQAGGQISGLQRATLYYFQMRVRLRKTWREWSDSITFVVP